jgi:hypothetical protein
MLMCQLASVLKLGFLHISDIFPSPQLSHSCSAAFLARQGRGKSKVIANSPAIYPDLQMMDSTSSFKTDLATVNARQVGHLVIFSAKNCAVCMKLLASFRYLSEHYLTITSNDNLVLLTCRAYQIGCVADIEETGLAISRFPTILGYIGSDLKTGWQGLFDEVTMEQCLSLVLSILADFLVLINENTYSKSISNE